MTDGWVFLGFAALLSVGAFLNGLRFARMSKNPLVGIKVLGLSVRGSELSIKRLNLIGKIQMVFAPFFFLFFAAIFALDF